MEKIFVLILILFIKFCVVESTADGSLELIKSAGYKGKSYEVETEDGYLLKVHRVLPQSNSTSKLPVFLMHGLFTSSSDFLLSGPKVALAYLLADNGYDVWLGNARGNKFSSKHKTLSTESTEFWTFSWHQIGFYDLPAMIDFMLNETKASKAFYVGHSQGSTALMVLLSSKPKFNQKIIETHLLAPAVFMKNSKVILQKFILDEIANGLLNDYSYLNLAGIWDLGKKISELLCVEQSTSLCAEVYYAVYGRNKNGIKVDNVIELNNFYAMLEVNNGLVCSMCLT